jgi:ubiquitin carboxyl-terminal hydrolase 16/45
MKGFAVIFCVAQVGFTSRKVNRHVEFPLILDVAPYCSSLCEGVGPGQRRVLYALYGLVEHSGRLQGGHYTAYVKVRPSLAPLTNFLHQHPPSPKDYLQR